MTLIFGTLFSNQATMGIVDEGSSKLVAMLEEHESIELKRYSSVSDLKGAVEAGAVDGGIVLERDFDSAVIQGEEVEIPIYIWGESLAKDRTIISVTVTNLIRELAAQETPVEIELVALGEESNIPWSDRLLPLVVLMAVFFGGFMLPAVSLLKEKETKTIDALAVTPVTIAEIFTSKALLGLVVSIVMGIVILAMNQAFGAQPGLLVMLIFLGAIMAICLGLLLGSVVTNMTVFFGNQKLLNMLLFAPALVYMFPSIPQWVGKIFPTYYVVEPLVEISQRGGGWEEIWLNVTILIGLDILLIGALSLMVSRKKQYAVT
jgi:ABC-2 type transport system permease protein